MTNSQQHRHMRGKPRKKNGDEIGQGITLKKHRAKPTKSEKKAKNRKKHKTKSIKHALYHRCKHQMTCNTQHARAV
jgi:hypothetical protein